MSNAINELVKLDFGSIEWISELRNKLCQNGALSEADIEAAFNKIFSQKHVDPIPLLDATSNNDLKKYSLFKLQDNQNVCGLHNQKLIEFSPHLTLIYGKNGSGKSSYYKILKDAFHSNQNLIGNIYNNSNDIPSAKIEFYENSLHLKLQKKGGNHSLTETNNKTINWTSEVQHPSNIKFCDKTILNSSLSKKNTGWSVNQYKFEYYDDLRKSVEEVEYKVRGKRTELNTSINTKFQTFTNGLKSRLNGSTWKSLINNESNKLKLLKEFEKLQTVTISTTEGNDKESLQKKSSQSISDLTGNIDRYKLKLKILTNIFNHTYEICDIFSKLEHFRGIHNEIKNLNKSINLSKFDQYKLIFDPSTNKDGYMDLIKKITETALTFGYSDYPENIDKCFYCNQSLQEENKSLIKDIHEILDNKVNSKIRVLKEQLNNFIIRINGVITNKLNNYDFTEICDLFSISDREEIDFKELQNRSFDKEILKQLKFDLMNSTEINTDISDLWNDNYLLNYLINHEKIVTEKKLIIENDNLVKFEKIKNDSQELLFIIEDKEFCVSQKKIIEEIIVNLNLSNDYLKTKTTFQTLKTKISKEKGKVEKKLVHDDYIGKFNDHLKFFNLANKEKIVRSFSNPDGTSKIDSKIKVEEKLFNLPNILSEGEAKIFSFCDWLTELELDDNEILVFDDPITSLDQANIYKIVDKIIDLSKKYQVIVFTHNFEFYHRLLQKSLGKKKMEKGKCNICESLEQKNQCIGLNKTTDEIYKCCSYYIIERILQPGVVKNKLMFHTLNWEQRIEKLRNSLLIGDTRDADKRLRTTINNFFEKFVLNDIKRDVYTDSDLITKWRGIKNICETDYNILMDVHERISNEGEVHESSLEVRTPLDTSGYIEEFNKTIKAINNIRSYDNQNPIKPIEEIAI